MVSDEQCTDPRSWMVSDKQCTDPRSCYWKFCAPCTLSFVNCRDTEVSSWLNLTRKDKQKSKELKKPFVPGSVCLYE